MSHVESVDTVLTDLEAVKAACARLGVDFVEGKKTYNWYGRHVGDHPLPKGVTKEELGKCDHVIRVPGVAYEVGLVRNKEGKGYKLAYDFWGPGQGLLQKFGNNLTKLVDAYSVEALKAKAKRLGYLTKETTTSSGAIQLKVTGFAT